MADFVISEIVSQDAIEQITTLNKALENAQAYYTQLAKEVAKDSTETSASFAELSKKVQDYEAKIKELEKAQVQYSKSYTDLEKELKAVQAQLKASQDAAQKNAEAQSAAGSAASQAAQGYESAAQSTEQQRQAALANAQALEAQRAAMLDNYQMSEQSRQLMNDTLGTYDQNVQRLAELDTELKNVSVAMSALNADQKNGLITDEQAVARRTELLERERELKAGKQDLQRVMKNEEKIAQEADGSYKQLSTTLTMMKDAYKQLNAEQRNSASGKALLADIQQLDTALKGSAGTMGEHNREVGNYEQAILAALGVNGRFATSILTLTRSGSGMSGMLAVATSKVKAFGAALWTLVKNPVFLAIAGIGAAAASLKWLYDYNQGIAEATRLTREFTGELDNEVIVAYRNNIQAIADVYGKEFKEVLEGADTLVHQYGISWAEAFDIIDKGFAAGADLNGTFLSQVKQFAPAFRDAGVSASKLVALIAQTRSGIFSEQGMSMMQMAFKRLREGTTATKEALAGIGIDVDKLYKDMADGTTTPIEALQKVSDKLNSVGENSQAAGAVLKDVFGRQGANGGMQMVKALKDIQTNLDEVQKQTGKYGELQRKLKEQQERLNNAMSAFFDLTDDGWENFILQVKVIVYKYLADFVTKAVQLYNRFVDWYNASASLRVGLAGVASVLYVIFNINKTVWKTMLDLLKNVGDGIRGLTTTLDGFWNVLKNPTEPLKGLNMVKQGINEIRLAMGRGVAIGPANILGMFKENFQTMVGLMQGAGGSKLGHATIPTMPAIPDEVVTEDDKYGGGGNNNQGGGGGSRSGSRGGRSGGNSAATQEAERQAEYMKDIQAKLNDARIAMIEQSYEREVAETKAGWQEKIKAIKGNSVEEVELRERYTTLMNRELEALEKEHNSQVLALQIKNQENLVAGLDKDASYLKDYWEERMNLLHMKQQQERNEAEANGEDLTALARKHTAEEVALEEEKAAHLLQRRQEYHAQAAQERKAHYTKEMNDLANHYIDGKITQEQYEQEKLKLTQQYAEQEARAQVENLERLLDDEYLVSILSFDQITALKKQLADAEIALDEQKNATIEQNNRTALEAQQKRIQKQIEMVQTAQKFVTEFANLGNALFEADAQKLEEAQDALDKAHEAETERITKLAETGQITTEEAERRKEVAEKKHAAESEKIAKKQAELKRRQAIFDKANNVATTVMNTAVAIMNAWATGKTLADKIAQTAIISALGAVQLATILAQPIPKYAKGTDSHKGGLAIVGDAGKRELVITTAGAFLTPDKPTLVDMPKGAYVHPDATALLSVARQNDATLAHNKGIAPIVNVDNDYSSLERATRENTAEIRRLQRLVQKGQTDTEYLSLYERI